MQKCPVQLDQTSQMPHTVKYKHAKFTYIMKTMALRMFPKKLSVQNRSH